MSLHNQAERDTHMALDLSTPKLRRPGGKPTILQIIPSTDYRSKEAACLALCRTDNGTEVLGVDQDGKLFILGSEYDL